MDKKKISKWKIQMKKLPRMWQRETEVENIKEWLRDTKDEVRNI